MELQTYHMYDDREPGIKTFTASETRSTWRGICNCSWMTSNACLRRRICPVCYFSKALRWMISLVPFLFTVSIGTLLT